MVLTMVRFWAAIKVTYDPVQERWRGMSFRALCAIASVGCPIGKMLTGSWVMVMAGVVQRVEIVGRYELKVVNREVVPIEVLVLLSSPSETKSSGEGGR